MLLNTDLLKNPVNWIKIGLMSATFILAVIFVVQLVTPAIAAPTGEPN